MRVTFDNFSTIRFLFTLLALVIIGASTFFSNRLVQHVAQEEHHKMALWAEATRKMASVEESADYAFLLKVIEDNTTIPCFIVASDGAIVSYRNIEVPKMSAVEEQEFWQHKKRRFSRLNDPIIIRIDKNSRQLIYYDNSLLLKELSYYPVVQWCIVLIFFLSLVFFFQSARKAERDRVWVGLSKETAHQLGTPISSLMAWVELFKSENIAPEVLPEMEKDVSRLQMIAERFSKVGSAPELKMVCLNDVLDNALAYMRKRVSSKIPVTCQYSVDAPIYLLLSPPLFSWVIENLCKNAVDAMEGRGAISVEVSRDGEKVCIDVSDTGKGIPKSKFKTVFNPGYTTKERGWGLGLSLVKRIVEEYHHGSIVVKRSELGKGTTFRIQLKAVDMKD